MTVQKTGVRLGDKDVDNLHEPSNEDKRLLFEAKEAIRSLTCPESKLVFTDLNGYYLGKYTSIRESSDGDRHVILDQLDPYETFKANAHIKKECMWESDYRRCIYIRNHELGQGYLEFWSEDIHGKWSTIRKGGTQRRLSKCGEE